MSTRNVSFKLKAKSIMGVTRILEGQIVPLLRRQKRFGNEISVIRPERN